MSWKEKFVFDAKSGWWRSSQHFPVLVSVSCVFSFISVGDYGLFRRDDDPVKGKWLEPARPLNFYPLNNGVSIVMCSKWQCNYSYWFVVIVRVKVVFRKVVETSVTNNSLSKDYLHPDNHDKPITDTPGFKPFTSVITDTNQRCCFNVLQLLWGFTKK